MNESPSQSEIVSSLEALWFSSRPAYIARTDGDGWETVGEFMERINRGHAPLSYKAVASQLLEMHRAGQAERGQTLVNGKPLICYRVKVITNMAKDEATLLIAHPSGNVKRVRAKPKRKRKQPVAKRNAGKTKGGK